MRINSVCFRQLLLLGISGGWLLAQSPQTVLLDIEVENVATYRDAVVDASKRALDPGPTTTPAPRAFTEFLTIGDIVAINGKPAKGTWTSRGMTLGLSPTAGVGFAVADVAQGAIADCKWEILQADGTFIGRLNDGGMFPHAIIGGAGAYFGVRGEQQTGTPRVVRPTRIASMAEDPSMRRILGGGTARHSMYIVPLFRPEIEAVLHPDFTLVTADKPARAGEVLIVRAHGLGPVRPGLEPHASIRFGASALQVVNSPTEAVFNGKDFSTINQIGWPGEVDTYRVDFQVPPDAVPGTASLYLRTAWIPGSSLGIAVR